MKSVISSLNLRFLPCHYRILFRGFGLVRGLFFADYNRCGFTQADLEARRIF